MTANSPFFEFLELPFSKQISPFKPAGVQISTYFVTSEVDTPFFAFDIQSDQLSGFDESAWAEPLF